MAAYEQYKDSGVKWLGEIPSHWEVRRIKWLFNEVNIPNSNLQYPLLSFSKTKGIVLASEIKDKESSSDLSKYKIIKAGQLLENRLQAWNGMFACSKIDGCVSPDYSVFEAADENGNTEFFAYVFRLPACVQLFANLSTGVGSGFNRLYTPQFYSVFTVFPPINEQNAIVEYLKTATADIDRAIEVQQQMIDALNERIQIIISNAVTKGLNPDAPLRDSGIDWLGQIPAHWETLPLKYLFTKMQSGKSLTSEQISEIGQYPVYGGNGIRGYYGSFNTSGNFLIIGRQGALCGNVHLVSGNIWATDHAVACLPTKESDLAFLYYLTTAMNLNQYATQSAQPGLAVGTIRAVKTVRPPLIEQQQIVRFIESNTVDLNKQIENCKNMIDLLTERKQIIINQVVTGKEKVI